MSLSLVSTPFLDELSAKIRVKPVPWEGYHRADLVTSEELALIKKVDKQPKARVENSLLSEGRVYALLYLRLLNKLQRIDTMQCLLVLIADALTGTSFPLHIMLSLHRRADHDERILLFQQTSESDPDLPYTSLLRYAWPMFPMRDAHLPNDQCNRSAGRVCPTESRTDFDRTSEVCFVLAASSSIHIRPAQNANRQHWRSFPHFFTPLLPSCKTVHLQSVM